MACLTNADLHSFGVGGAILFRQSLRIKFTKRARLLKWVDNGDTFATHCAGGFVGTIATGLFGSREVAAYDGALDIPGGVLFDGNFRQIAIQLLEACIGFTWAFVISYVIYALIDCIPGFEVLATDRLVELLQSALEFADENPVRSAWAWILHRWKNRLEIRRGRMSSTTRLLKDNCY